MVVIGQFSTPEEAADHGLVWSSRQNTLDLFKKIFSEWEPGWQALPINQAFNVSALAASVPGLFVALKLRKLLPGLMRAKANWIPLPLSVMVPGITSGMFHANLVTHDILLQETACPVCVETRAISGQVALGVGMSSLSAYAGSLIVGAFLQAKWFPRSPSELFNLTRKVVSQSSTLMIGWSVVQMVIAGGLVTAQRISYETVMEELERRVQEDKRGIDHRVLNLDRE